MACLEAAASPQVKAALVAAGGAAGWVPRRGVEGGVTSARSNLNADIHLLDNAASRAGHLLESVAGDPAAVTARREEIVAALALTAKPYFGDVESMTYLSLLERFTERCATGRFGRYDDGAWGHPSWRCARFGAVSAVRGAAGRGRVRTRRRAPSISTTRLPRCGRSRLAYPSCGDVAAASRRRPVLPRGLRPPRQAGPVRPRPGRRGPALVHGRRALAGPGRPLRLPTRSSSSPAPRPSPASPAPTSPSPTCSPASRPSRSRASTSPAEPRARLAAPGPAPAPLADLAGGDGPVAALCAAQCVVGDDGRTHPNPLWRLVAPGDTITEHDGKVTIRPSSATVETVTLSPDGDDAVVTSTPPPPPRSSSASARSPRPCSRGARRRRGARGVRRRRARRRARRPPSRTRCAACAPRGRARRSCRARIGRRPARRTTACRSTSRSRSPGPR